MWDREYLYPSIKPKLCQQCSMCNKNEGLSISFLGVFFPSSPIISLILLRHRDHFWHNFNTIWALSQFCWDPCLFWLERCSLFRYKLYPERSWDSWDLVVLGKDSSSLLLVFNGWCIICYALLDTKSLFCLLIYFLFVWYLYM